MFQKIKKINSFTWIVFLLVIAGVILRLLNLPQLFHFTYDEEVFAFVGKRMLVNQHIPLIGGVTPMHVHLAPYFYWLSGLILAIGKLSPLIWGIAGAMLAGVTMLFLFKSSKTMLGKTTGFIAVIIYAFSYYQNIFDRHYWGLIFNGILSVIVIYSLYQILNQRRKYLYILALSLGFGIHTDPSTIVLLLLSMFVVLIGRPRVHIRSYLVALLLFGMTFVPLVWFDLRHDFANSKGIFQYISEVKAGKEGIVPMTSVQVFKFVPQTLAKILFLFGDTDLAKQYSYCTQYARARVAAVPWWGILIVVGIVGIVLLRLRSDKSKSQNQARIIILSLFGVTYVGILLYGIILHGDLFDHYLSVLFVPFIILVADAVSNIWKEGKAVVVLALTIFVISNLILLSQAYHRFGYFYKKAAVEWAIASVGNEQFSLDAISDCFRYNGYRYLFYIYGKEPSKSYVDASLGYLYDVSPASVHPRLTVVIINPDDQPSIGFQAEYLDYKRKLIASAIFGKIEVMIVDNSQLEYVGKY